MLATRIIPTLLVRNGQLVKGKRFDSWRSVGVPAQAMRIYANRSCDELVYLDVGATPDGRGPDFDAISRLTCEFFTPVAVGGGVRTLEDIRALLNAGADKIVIGTAALQNPNLINKAAAKFGSQAITVAIDYRPVAWVTWGASLVSEAVFTRCGTELKTPNPVDCAKQFAARGAGEILLTSIDRDGTMGGYDLDMIREVSNVVSIPVVASGGCGCYEDMYKAIKAGASAVAASSLFLFTDCTPQGAAAYLSEKGIVCRQ